MEAKAPNEPDTGKLDEALKQLSALDFDESAIQRVA
jgi:hypothetical protein